MASDWRALRHLAAVALERSNDPTSHIRVPYSKDEKALQLSYKNNGVRIQPFVFESVTNYASRT